MKHNIFSIILLSISCAKISFASTAATASNSAVATPLETTSSDSNGSKNPVFQLAGYVKNSLVRMKDGSVQLYTNHKRCNEIRSKQNAYLANMAASLPEIDQKKAKKYTMSAGGISYEEFDFLQKGKDDRGKVANVAFIMVFAPNFVPYAFMFFPDMLPSPFSMPMNKIGTNFSKWDLISRERVHAVLQSMIDVERQARVAPMISNINPFGKGKTKRMMEKMDSLGHACGALLAADGARGAKGAELLMKVLEDEIYTKEEPKKDRTALVIVPGAIIKGVGRALDAPSSTSFLPNFITRGKVLNCLTQLTAADEFLVNQNIDLGTLSPELLQDACNKRLIGPGKSNQEMLDGLYSWLDLSVKQPCKKKSNTDLHYNGNLARIALLAYNAVDSARDLRASSFLPRLMFQGQLYSTAK